MDTLKRGAWTPWGSADIVEPFPGAPEGVVLVSTPSHGGAFVPDSVAATMPEGLRTIGTRGAKGWWFEEDCAATAVALAWPVKVPADRLAFALGWARQFYPSHVGGGTGCGGVSDTRDGFHRCAAFSAAPSVPRSEAR